MKNLNFSISVCKALLTVVFLFSLVGNVSAQLRTYSHEEAIQEEKALNPLWVEGIYYECYENSANNEWRIGSDDLIDESESDKCLLGHKGPEQCVDKTTKRLKMKWICGDEGLEGKFEEYEKDGSKVIEKNFKHGKLEKINVFYPSGKIKAEYEYNAHGTRSGISKEYSENGKLIRSSKAVYSENKSNLYAWEDVEEYRQDGGIEKYRFEYIQQSEPKRCESCVRFLRRKIISGKVVEEIEQGASIDPRSI